MQIEDQDTLLRPAMTTGNSIIVGVYEEVTYVPLEGIHNEGDSLTYVIVKSGFGSTRKEVQVGASNDNYAIIEAGIDPGQKILLTKPANADKLALDPLPTQQP